MLRLGRVRACLRPQTVATAHGRGSRRRTPPATLAATLIPVSATSPTSWTARSTVSGCLWGGGAWRGGGGGAAAAFGFAAVFVTGGFAAAAVVARGFAPAAFVARGFAPAAFGLAGVRLGGDAPPARLSLRTPGRERGRLPRMPSGFSFTGLPVTKFSPTGHQHDTVASGRGGTNAAAARRSRREQPQAGERVLCLDPTDSG